MKMRNSRGAFLVELLIAVAVMALLFAVSAGGFAHALRIQTQLEIDAANTNALATEVSRLRSLPLSAYYEADGVTLRTHPLRYFRKLVLPGSSVESRLYAQIDVALATPQTLGGPVQAIITSRPVYLAQPLTERALGVATTNQTPATSLPNGIDLSATMEAHVILIL